MEISNITNSDRSEVLVQALPYIQKYQNKTVVIKYGGNAMVNEELQDAVMTDIVLLRSLCRRTALYRRRDNRYCPNGFGRQSE